MAQRIQGRVKADRAATEAAGFADKRSYICWDGREVLYGKDWEKRKQELWERAHGHCEYVIEQELTPVIGPGMYGPSRYNYMRCQEDSGDPCHDPMPRHPKRDDRMSNLKFYCRRHHNMTDPQREKRRLRFGEGRGESAGT